MNPAEELKMELNATGACVDVLKDLSPTISARVARRIYEAFFTDEKTSHGKPSAIRQLIESEDFRSLNTAQNRYLEVLRILEASDPECFAQVASTDPNLRGKKRTYFALSKDAIELSGKSTNPVRLKRWWADVNCSTPEKRKRVMKLMEGMGFPKAECVMAANAIR